MDKKRKGKLKGFVVLVFLILILGIIDAAWIIYHKSTITTNIIGEKKVYFISQQFSDTLSLNTSTGPANVTTLMKIDDLTEDINISFRSETDRTVLDSDCPNYKDNEDCNVTVAYLYSNGTRKLLIYKNKGDETANFTLLALPIINIFEYRIDCIKDSCSQIINSTIILEEVR